MLFLCALLVSSIGDASDDVEVMYHTSEICAAAMSPHRAAAPLPVIAID
jgi:hypothetical protein